MMHVASVHLKCFRCLFQVFHTNVVKVDRDVLYVAIVIHVCYKRQACLSGCYICFTHILQVFYLDVAHVCNVFRPCLVFVC
jgi:hypothetical protein